MREEKQLLLDEVKEKIEESTGFVVASYEGLNATSVREFRNHISEVKGEFEVVRKRIFVKAAKAAGIDFDPTTLEGHIGVIFAKEETQQVLKAVLKHGKETIRLLGGQIDGELCNAEEVEIIARLPALPELRAQVLGLIETVLSGPLTVMQAVLTGVLRCMDEKTKKEI
ncbi:MAG: 50S ribosomal protein L10 [Chlamydiae bacterium]|nr:50S ribosomal protein L10 [Chlamydiota bacterium]